jgi:hypothetical protein
MKKKKEKKKCCLTICRGKVASDKEPSKYTIIFCPYFRIDIYAQFHDVQDPSHGCHS